MPASFSVEGFMCGVPDSLRKKLLPPGFGMEEKVPATGKPENWLLLEFAAENDLAGFKKTAAALVDGAGVHAPAGWYARRPGGRKMGWDQRTPLMVAALHGSADVVAYLLGPETTGVDVNFASPSDGATALHCAAAGGALDCLEIVRLLITAGADLRVKDAAGNRPVDVIVNPGGNGPKKSLERVMMKSGPGSDGGSPKSPESEKKEYPVDASMPDINSGVYGTDEFRMYCFKVAPCSRAYSHDWTECPFAHPGENARRRDPRKHEYSCVLCPDFRKNGSCRAGDGCEYAHGVFESWLHPAQYRTRLCKEDSGCARKVCFFAHKVDELRKPETPFSSVVDLLSLSSSASPSSAAAPVMSPLRLVSPGLGWTPSQLAAAGRLKASLSAKCLDLGMDLPMLESLSLYQSGRPGAALTGGLIAGRNGMMAGFDGYSASTNQYQTSSLLKSIGFNNIPSSPVRTHSPMAPDSRAAAFAKRSQSFCYRSAANVTAEVPIPAMTGNNTMMSDWSSPTGKLDWAVRDDEMHRLTKSATFAFRNSNSATLPVGIDANHLPRSGGGGSAGASPEKRPAWGGGPAPVKKEQMVA